MEQQCNQCAVWESLSFLAAEKTPQFSAVFLELCVGNGAGEGGWGRSSSEQRLFS